LLTGERAHYELAAGRDVKSYISTMERFASDGGMLPEQIWDRADTNGLVLGGPAGSAMPLVWAHAEYLKLLRSTTDGRVFERISAVEQRYAGGGQLERNIEVFKLRRPLRSIVAGKTLRITSAERFRVIWSPDAWQTRNVLDSTQVGYAGSYADLKTEEKQTGKVSFTLLWSVQNRWEDRNFDVELEAGVL
jgi:glucoamylase